MGQSTSARLTFDNNNPQSILHRKNFNEVYEIGKEIGVGSFASVYSCYNISTNIEYAVKLIDKRYLTEKELIGLRDEIQILKNTNHRNIIKLYDIFDDGKTVRMVLELCNGEDLFDEIVSSTNHHFDEKRAAIITHKLVNGLQYLHDNYIVHRDLKPENILFTNDGTLKITDFGLAHYQSQSSNNNNLSDDNSSDNSDDTSTSNVSPDPGPMLMKTCCGTPHYVAPEIISKSEYTNKCDTWSLGVILYIMLVGYQPFNASSLNDIYKLIVRGKYSFKSKRWLNVSDDAKDLVRSCLNIDPQKRYSAQQIKEHPFLKKYVNPQ